jgi:hypothetical protein
MFDRLTIEQFVRTSWCKARHHAAAAALWSADHTSLVLGLLYGLVAYFASAVLMGVPGRALVVLMVVAPTGWWCFGRYKVLASAQMSKIGFFTGENGPLRLSEDIQSAKAVYCIGVRNEGRKAVAGVRVTIDVIDGQPPQTPAASLPIFRNPADNTELQPGESEYFCVMRIVDGAGQDDGTVALCCRDNQAAPRCGLRELQEGATITLSACGEGAPRLTRRIRIASKRDAGAPWSLDLTLLPDAEEAPAPVLEQSHEARSPAPVAAAPPMPVIEESAATPPLAPDAAATAIPAVEQGAVVPTPGQEPPAAEEPPAHSERVRRLLARQART